MLTSTAMKIAPSYIGWQQLFIHCWQLCVVSRISRRQAMFLWYDSMTCIRNILHSFLDSRGWFINRADVSIQKSLIPDLHDVYFTDLNIQIDGALGLRLSEEELETLTRCRYTSARRPSINPAENFTQLVPQFLLIKLKRPNKNKDALIQLALWASAEFTKRRNEGWSIDMPILAVEIKGDDWRLWAVYATPRKPSNPGDRDFEVVFVGPRYMGNTEDMYGIFQILEWLCRCSEWGLKEYKQWVKAELLQLTDWKWHRVGILLHYAILHAYSPNPGNCDTRGQVRGAGLKECWCCCSTRYSKK